MRRNIRDQDYVSPFIKKREDASALRLRMLSDLVDQITFVHGSLKASAETLIAQLEVFPANVGGEVHSILWRWRPHRDVTKARLVEVLLCIEDRSSSRRLQKMLSLREHATRIERLAPVMGKRKAAHFSKGLDKFLVLADRAARWATAGDQPSILNTGGVRFGLMNWIDGVGDSCEAAAKRVVGEIESFIDLDNELNSLAFEFNEARQPIRFHSIICRRDVHASDPLAPSAPRFRVVVFFDRKTGKRSSRDVQSYKQKMAVDRLVVELRKQLNREPTKAEVESHRAIRRTRTPNANITAELISHCKLGKHSAGINRLQKKIADAMGKWEASRAYLQRLL